MVEKVTIEKVDLRITFVPLLAFFNAAELRIRFLGIFNYLFSIQDELKLPRMFLCLERAPHPRNVPAAWKEI